MLSKNGVRIRFIICLSLFFLSGSQLITGGIATLCGVIGVIELSTALLRYSPVCEIKAMNMKTEPPKYVPSSLNLSGHKA
jgi:hypothetical protein